MVDLLTETAISLREVTKLPWIPARRAGKRLGVATVYRWTTIGVRGVRLECLNVGCTRCTTIEALQRFFQRLTPPGDAGEHVATRVGPRTPSQHKADQLRTQKELAAELASN